jgi:hypothetical protein
LILCDGVRFLLTLLSNLSPIDEARFLDLSRAVEASREDLSPIVEAIRDDFSRICEATDFGVPREPVERERLLRDDEDADCVEVFDGDLVRVEDFEGDFVRVRGDFFGDFDGDFVRGVLEAVDFGRPTPRPGDFVRPGEDFGVAAVTTTSESDFRVTTTFLPALGLFDGDFFCPRVRLVERLPAIFSFSKILLSAAYNSNLKKKKS